MSTMQRVVSVKPDLPEIEFRPTASVPETVIETSQQTTEANTEQEDIFDWLSSH